MEGLGSALTQALAFLVIFVFFCFSVTEKLRITSKLRVCKRTEDFLNI